MSGPNVTLTLTAQEWNRIYAALLYRAGDELGDPLAAKIRAALEKAVKAGGA